MEAESSYSVLLSLTDSEGLNFTVVGVTKLPPGSILTLGTNSNLVCDSGTHPQSVVTTTPRPVPVVKRLLERHDGSVIVTRGSTFDNAANRAPSALAELRARYEGTDSVGRNSTPNS